MSSTKASSNKRHLEEKTPLTTESSQTQEDEQIYKDQQNGGQKENIRKNELSTQQKLTIGISIFSGILIGFFVVYTFMPTLTKNEYKVLYTLPTTVKELKILQNILRQISEKHTYYVYFLLCYVYTVLCSFGLPGAGPIGMLAASMFGGVRAFLVCTFCSTLGGSLCYWISYLIGGRIVRFLFPNKVKSFSEKVNKNMQDLFWFMLGARISPVLPKWFVNLVSPLVGIPFKIYLIATIIGYIPSNLIIVRTGLTLNQLDKLGMNLDSFLALLILGLVALIPAFIRRKFGNKLKEN